MNQPDPAEIAPTPEEMATEYLAEHNNPKVRSSHPLSAYGKAVIERLLAALATAEERAENAERDEYLAMLCADAKPVEEVVASLKRAAAAESLVEAMEGLHTPPMLAWAPSAVPYCQECKQNWPCKTADLIANYHKATGPQAENEGAT